MRSDRPRILPFFAVVTLILFLLLFFSEETYAVKKWRTSKLKNGWQIWLEAGDFDRRDKDKNIKKVSEADKKHQGDGYIAENNNGVSVAIPIGQFGDVLAFERAQKEAFAEYDINVPKEFAAPAFAFIRCKDLRGGGQSWWIALNPAEGGAPLQVDTTGAWVWKGGATSPLKAGKNVVMAARREGDDTRGANLLDIICISTSNFLPTDDDYKNATKESLPVESRGKLATTWGEIKLMRQGDR